MLENIRRFPDMLLWQPEVEGEVPEYSGGRIAIAGMGGSAAAADFFYDWTGKDVRVVRGYDLPPFLSGDDFFVAISYSGNTEETLSAYSQAVDRGMRGFVITTGGKLGEMAARDGYAVLKVPQGYHPREAFGYLLKALVYGARLSGIAGAEDYAEFERAARSIARFQPELDGMDSPTYETASEIYRRVPLIYADSSVFSVALRWKNQINENANAAAFAMPFPEHNHNEIEGFDHPEFLDTKFWIVFLRTDYDHPRVSLRMDLTEEILRDYVLGSRNVRARGESKLEQMLYLVWFGDFVSYWLSVEYGEDPYRIDRIKTLKGKLSGV